MGQLQPFGHIRDNGCETAKSLKDWNKEGVKSTIEFLEEEIGGWVNGVECID